MYSKIWFGTCYVITKVWTLWFLSLVVFTTGENNDFRKKAKCSYLSRLNEDDICIYMTDWHHTLALLELLLSQLKSSGAGSCQFFQLKICNNVGIWRLKRIKQEEGLLSLTEFMDNSSSNCWSLIWCLDLPFAHLYLHSALAFIWKCWIGKNVNLPNTEIRIWAWTSLALVIFWVQCPPLLWNVYFSISSCVYLLLGIEARFAGNESNHTNILDYFSSPTEDDCEDSLFHVDPDNCPEGYFRCECHYVIMS